MKLLILIACLGIERYLHVGGVLRRFSWMENYILMMQGLFPSDSPFSRGFSGIFIIIFPIAVLIGIIFSVMMYYKIGLSGLGLYFIVLLYCLGPNDLYHSMKVYFTAVETENTEHKSLVYQEITGESLNVDETESVISRKMTENILIQANSAIFAVVIYFLVFGILGVLVYRMISVMAKITEEGKSCCIPFAYEVIQLNALANWLPARITAFFYSFVGGFHMFSVWARHIFSGVQNNNLILTTCGIATIMSGSNGNILSPIEENKKAISLVDRALVILIIIWAVFLMGTLLH